ncbi:hypothetical protein Pst134EA_033452 [Puccinia striiformis f. sp. tritici]|uniref:hypothetical protein n=1 Tax=Puccinia striiformis f. sp. tritici TaxID=168172 RepID=UPI002008C99D|nr:hypothetical protein Pst134EA_033452 [Puccinia striiformis f. sp. tritici]KAH9465759.1 hypothetical protein Pst134EA_033452 [Puccinia striiformis f. sp. tritici]
MSSNTHNIPDLPNEVLELIFQAILSGDQSWYPPTHERESATPIGELRIVCRRWSNLITDRHLYHRLVLDNGTRAKQFINHRKASLRLSPSNIRPKCQVLHVGELWTWGARPKKNENFDNRDDSMVTPTLLEGLVDLFRDTIVDLELKFINYFALPTSTVRAIGRIKNLRTLQLGYENRYSSGNSPTRNRRISFHHDTDLFCSLLSGAQGLECLDIDMFDPSYCEDISEHALARVQLPNITHLVAGSFTSADVAVSLARALKPTLTMLSNSNYDDDGEFFLRVFETLEDTLQGLYITRPLLLEPISHLNFSSLRLLQISSWEDCHSDVSDLDMLSHAPIEILALSGYIFDRQEVPKSPFFPFERLPALKRLVFYGRDSKFTAPECYLRACQEHEVECLYFRGSSLPDLMEFSFPTGS